MFRVNCGTDSLLIAYTNSTPEIIVRPTTAQRLQKFCRIHYFYNNAAKLSAEAIENAYASLPLVIFTPAEL